MEDSRAYLWKKIEWYCCILQKSCAELKVISNTFSPFLPLGNEDHFQTIHHRAFAWASYAVVVTLELLDQLEKMKYVEVPKTLFLLLKRSHSVIKVTLENEALSMYMSYYIYCYSACV